MRAAKRPPMGIEERFWSYVAKSERCWTWNGPSNEKGYGVLNLRSNSRKGINRRAFAHRFSYSLHFGAIEDGIFVCHRCDNPGCVRPDHLFLGTPLDNSRDMVEKGRVQHHQRERSACWKGHRYTPENTRYVRPKNEPAYRICKTCVRERARRAYRAHRDRLTATASSARPVL
jgi:hypothetical protein